MGKKENAPAGASPKPTILEPLTQRDLRDAYLRIAGPPPVGEGPDLWRHAFYGISSTADPCPGFRERQWRKVFDAAHAFLERHAPAAHALGWSSIDLFAVHATVGVANVSVCGALMVGSGALVAAVEPNIITFELDGRPAGRYFRTPPAPIVVPVWDFGQ